MKINFERTLPYCFLTLICFLFFLQGCKKDEENKVTGKWLKVAMSAQELSEKDTVIWTFYDGNKMCRFQSFMQNNARVRYYDTTSYEIKRDFPDWTVKFSKTGEWSMSIAEHYTIEKVDNKILVLNPVEAYPRIEFSKLK